MRILQISTMSGDPPTGIGVVALIIAIVALVFAVGAVAMLRGRKPNDKKP